MALSTQTCWLFVQIREPGHTRCCMDKCVCSASAYYGLSVGRKRCRVENRLVSVSRSLFIWPHELSLRTMTDEVCHCELVFQSPTPVLPNGSCSIPLGPAQNLGCHLTLNETTGALMGNRSDSGDFVVGLQFVFFRTFPPRSKV